MIMFFPKVPFKGPDPLLYLNTLIKSEFLGLFGPDVNESRSSGVPEGSGAFSLLLGWV